LKPAPRPEGKIIFAPLAPFDVLFFVLSEKFAQTSSHPKKPLLENCCWSKSNLIYSVRNASPSSQEAFGCRAP